MTPDPRGGCPHPRQRCRRLRVQPPRTNPKKKHARAGPLRRSWRTVPTPVAEGGQRARQKGSFRARGTPWPSSTITAPCYRSSRCCGTTQGGHLRHQGRPDSPGSPLSKLTRPDSVPRRGGRGGVNPRRPRSGAELWHLPLSKVGPKADQRLRRAYLLGLCASSSTGRRRSLLCSCQARLFIFARLQLLRRFSFLLSLRSATNYLLRRLTFHQQLLSGSPPKWSRGPCQRGVPSAGLHTSCAALALSLSWPDPLYTWVS